MIEYLKQNVILVTLDSIKGNELLEYENIKRLSKKLECKLNKATFENCLWVFANTDTKKTLQETPVLKVDTKGYKTRVLIWIGEESGAIPSDNLLSKYDLCFKAYMRSEYPDKHLYAMPLITPSEVPVKDIVPILSRQYNVFFSGNLNRNRLPLFVALNSHMPWWLRLLCPFYGYKVGYRLLKLVYGGKDYDISDEIRSAVLRFNNGFNTGLPKEEYARITTNSKIILSPRGFQSTECFRMYESMRQGCIVVNEILPNVPYYQGIPVIQINSWKNIHTTLNSLLNNPDKLEEMSAESIKYYNGHLSLDAISNIIVEKIENI